MSLYGSPEIDDWWSLIYRHKFGTEFAITDRLESGASANQRPGHRGFNCFVCVCNQTPPHLRPLALCWRQAFCVGKVGLTNVCV